MHAPHPLRGLLAGLLALVGFASAAIALAAGGTNDTTTTAQAAAVRTATGFAGDADLDGRRSDFADGRDGHHR
jgi:hypothetical protein